MKRWTNPPLTSSIYLILCCLIFQSNLSFAQIIPLPEVDEVPRFPGGISALRQYLDTNLDFPDVADIAEEKLVIVEFSVDAVGKAENPKILWANNDTAKVAAIALIYKMPKWLPARTDDLPVASIVRLPITYYRPANKKNLGSDHEQITSELRETLYFDINYGGARTKAEFPGGVVGLKTYLAKNLVYPQEAKEKGVMGVVEMLVKINKNGKLEDYEVVQSLGDGCDEEALRLMDMMPDWKPATIDGQPIASKQVVKIRFALKIPADSVYKKVDQMPAFPDGQLALLQFLAANIEYPTIAKENGVEGMVVTQFIVEKDGSLSDIHIAKGIGAGCDEQAIKVVKMMPKWQPGVQRKQPVRVQFNLPIRFKLE